MRTTSKKQFSTGVAPRRAEDGRALRNMWLSTGMSGEVSRFIILGLCSLLKVHLHMAS
jgi:hypothetical protein